METQQDWNYFMENANLIKEHAKRSPEKPVVVLINFYDILLPKNPLVSTKTWLTGNDLNGLKRF